MSRFRTDVVDILNQKKIVEHSHALERLIESVSQNQRLALSKVRAYKPFGLILLTVVPLLAALLSALIAAKQMVIPLLPPGGIEPVEILLSVTLTMLTILNSIFKPSQRFQQACLIGIGIERFTTEFMADLEGMTDISPKSLADFVKWQHNDFEKFEVALIELALPLEAASIRLSEDSRNPRAKTKSYAH